MSHALKYIVSFNILIIISVAFPAHASDTTPRETTKYLEENKVSECIEDQLMEALAKSDVPRVIRLLNPPTSCNQERASSHRRREIDWQKGVSGHEKVLEDLVIATEEPEIVEEVLKHEPKLKGYHFRYQTVRRLAEVLHAYYRTGSNKKELAKRILKLEKIFEMLVRQPGYFALPINVDRLKDMPAGVKARYYDRFLLNNLPTLYRALLEQFWSELGNVFSDDVPRTLNKKHYLKLVVSNSEIETGIRRSLSDQRMSPETRQQEIEDLLEKVPPGLTPSQRLLVFNSIDPETGLSPLELTASRGDFTTVFQLLDVVPFPSSKLSQKEKLQFLLEEMRRDSRLHFHRKDLISGIRTFIKSLDTTEEDKSEAKVPKLSELPKADNKEESSAITREALREFPRAFKDFVPFLYTHSELCSSIEQSISNDQVEVFKYLSNIEDSGLRYQDWVDMNGILIPEALRSDYDSNYAQRLPFAVRENLFKRLEKALKDNALNILNAIAKIPNIRRTLAPSNAKDTRGSDLAKIFVSRINPADDRQLKAAVTVVRVGILTPKDFFYILHEGGGEKVFQSLLALKYLGTGSFTEGLSLADFQQAAKTHSYHSIEEFEPLKDKLTGRSILTFLLDLFFSSEGEKAAELGRDIVTAFTSGEVLSVENLRLIRSYKDSQISKKLGFDQVYRVAMIQVASRALSRGETEEVLQVFDDFGFTPVRAEDYQMVEKTSPEYLEPLLGELLRSQKVRSVDAKPWSQLVIKKNLRKVAEPLLLFILKSIKSTAPDPMLPDQTSELCATAIRLLKFHGPVGDSVMEILMRHKESPEFAEIYVLAMVKALQKAAHNGDSEVVLRIMGELDKPELISSLEKVPAKTVETVFNELVSMNKIRPEDVKLWARLAIQKGLRNVARGLEQRFSAITDAIGKGDGDTATVLLELHGPVEPHSLPPKELRDTILKTRKQDNPNLSGVYEVAVRNGILKDESKAMGQEAKSEMDLEAVARGLVVNREIHAFTKISPKELKKEQEEFLKRPEIQKLKCSTLAAYFDQLFKPGEVVNQTLVAALPRNDPNYLDPASFKDFTSNPPTTLSIENARKGIQTVIGLCDEESKTPGDVALHAQYVTKKAIEKIEKMKEAEDGVVQKLMAAKEMKEDLTERFAELTRQRTHLQRTRADAIHNSLVIVASAGQHCSTGQQSGLVTIEGVLKIGATQKTPASLREHLLQALDRKREEIYLKVIEFLDDQETGATNFMGRDLLWKDLGILSPPPTGFPQYYYRSPDYQAWGPNKVAHKKVFKPLSPSAFKSLVERRFFYGKIGYKRLPDWGFRYTRNEKDELARSHPGYTVEMIAKTVLDALAKDPTYNEDLIEVMRSAVPYKDVWEWAKGNVALYRRFNFEEPTFKRGPGDEVTSEIDWEKDLNTEERERLSEVLTEEYIKYKQYVVLKENEKKSNVFVLNPSSEEALRVLLKGLGVVISSEL